MLLAERTTGEQSTGEESAAADNLTIRFATADDASAVARLYERVFGKDGVKAKGHEAYPAPDMFSPQGVLRVIDDPERDLLVADRDGTTTGGMIIHHLGPLHREFACVCVDPSCRGLGISPRLLGFARGLAEQSALTINSTEIVTHSVNSQAAHARAGYDRITGFGFCQYPRVFFRDHQESCAWVTRVDGSVARRLRRQRATGEVQEMSPWSPMEQELYLSLKERRQVFVPPRYRQITGEILEQFCDLLDYEIHCPQETARISCDSTAGGDVWLDPQEGEPFTYLYCGRACQEGWQTRVDECIAASRCDSKHFIQARVFANGANAADYVRHLWSRGFILLGILPLYRLNEKKPGEGMFDDLMVLQWIRPDVLAGNALPGDTGAVVKLYGHPANLNGSLTKIQRQELARLQGAAEPL